MRLFDALHIPRIVAQGGSHIDLAAGANEGVDWVALLSTVGIVVGVAAGLALAVYVFRKIRPRESQTASPYHSLDLGTRRKVQSAKDSGQFEVAGELLTKAGDHEEAAMAYVRGELFEKAARSFQEAGLMSQAILYYKKAGEILTAAALYAELGQHMAAAAEFRRAEDHQSAAQHYAKAKDYKRAGECFEKAEEFLQAGIYYEKVDALTLAAGAYAQYFEDVLTRASGNLTEVEDERKYAKRAGEIYRDEGDLDRASRVLQQGGFFEEAARCLRTTGDLTRAAEMLIQAKQPLLAAEVLEEAGEETKAAMMRAEAAMKSKDYPTAAKMYRSAGDFKKAVKIFEKLEDHEAAADIYDQLGHKKKAYELYVKAEKWAHAAQCAEALEDYQHAAELYRKIGDIEGELRSLTILGDHFRAGRLQYEHRRFANALKSLNAIDSRDPIYPRALELAGDVLQAQGRFEKAYSRYRAALGNRPPSTAVLDLIYKMGRMLEEEQDRNGALEHFNSILTIDKNFEDVSLRVKSLLGRGRSRRVTVPGGTSSGIFSAPIGEDGAPGQRYELVEEIARGGMGVVFKARDTVLGRIVAYKILGENLRDNETAVKYFLREARAAAALSHPNIVTIFDAGDQDGDYYMAMEYVEGTTLKELIKRKGALPEDQVRYIAIHCCRGLQYAHSKGIIHRDIKSGNVMITRDKALKIMDFGLAKVMREYQKEHTQQVGTPFYMSPEQVIGKHIDFRSDLYSLGCMIFECATGTVPFFKGDLSYHHVHTKPPSPRSINPALSRGMERVILKMLEKQPDHRQQTAKDILDEITEL